MLCANQIDCRITYPTSIVAFDQRPEIVRFPPYGRYDAMMEISAASCAARRKRIIRPSMNSGSITC